MDYFIPFIPFIVVCAIGFISLILAIVRCHREEDDIQFGGHKKGRNCMRAETHIVRDNSMTIEYEGEQRYVDGKAIKTPEQLKEWWSLKGLTENISSHLRHIEEDMYSGRCGNYANAKEEWMTFYNRLRQLCIRHRLWNPVLADRQIFIPTPEQSALEVSLYKRIDDLCEIGLDNAFRLKIAEENIRNYILSTKGHVVVRKDMVNQICGTNEELKKEYRRLCNKLVSDGILSESHDQKGQLTIKLRRKKTVTESNVSCDTTVLPASSSFNPTLYGDISYEMLAKVKHTVGVPENVDRRNNRCEFVSLSTGDRYFTSLNSCTCPAFSRGGPCKHMVAFAKYLGYIE